MDLIILENQLPRFVLEGLFNLAFESNKQNSDCSSFLELSMSYLKVTVEFVPTQNVTKLPETGVKFKVGSNQCLLDIKYNKRVLKIPRLCIKNDTEEELRNRIALECFLHLESSYVTDYIYLMDSLADTPNLTTLAPLMSRNP
ncbi:hypothetical protein ACSBR2_040218 [Camellia fascicularis]